MVKDVMQLCYRVYNSRVVEVSNKGSYKKHINREQQRTVCEFQSVFVQVSHDAECTCDQCQQHCVWQHVEYGLSSELTDTVTIIPLSTEQ